ncbi:MAG: hypothetical protein JNM27_02880 [Leptospirales bacterium]|nr:hypothetical protein [Leptospirales bacterium]
MILLLLGATSMGYMIAALFFLKFWRQEHDRFFLWFAASFELEGLNRGIGGVYAVIGDDDAVIFTIRLISYLFIVVAILEKNIRARVLPN